MECIKDEIQEVTDMFEEHFGIAAATQRQLIPPVVDINDSDHENTRELVETAAWRFVEAVETESDDECRDHFVDESGDKENHTCCSLNCLSKINQEELDAHLMNLQEMDKEEKEYIIMSVIQSCREEKTPTKRGDRKRSTSHYSFRGQKLCKSAFLKAYDITEYKLKALVAHVKEYGVSPRKHGNRNRKPRHAISFDDVMKIVTFIRTYSEEHGLPQPAAPRGRDGIPPIYLPCSLTKVELHKLYTKAMTDANETRIVKRTTFCEVWKSCLPHIVIASARSDVCSRCELNRKMVMDAVTEGEKMQAAQTIQSHIQAATTEHALYLKLVKKSREGWIEGRQSSTVPESVHYTFDFAQNVSIPHHARQMGPLYFLTLKKVQVFGFRTDGEPRQLHYLYDESQTIGKDGTQCHGPNAVISMVHDALARVSQREAVCSIHTDNCIGQNKNRYVIGYLMWRVMTGRHREITLHMQIPGHSRCLIDAGFACFKRVYRRCDADCMADIASMVERSAEMNEAIMYPEWSWFNWKEYLERHFKPVKAITTYQHFRVSSACPGIVFVRKSPNDEEVPIEITKMPGHLFHTDERPEMLPPGGLSEERQRYLINHVRKYVRPHAQDETCPPVQ